MTARYEYEIGSTSLNRVNVKTLGSATLTHEWQRVEPFGMTYSPYSMYRVSASGMEYGDGFPLLVWEFDTMHPDQLDALLAYIPDGSQSAEVHIKTRLTDGTYDTFSAVMHRPKVPDEGAYVNNRWHDVRIRFSCLETD